MGALYRLKSVLECYNDCDDIVKLPSGSQIEIHHTEDEMVEFDCNGDQYWADMEPVDFLCDWCDEVSVDVKVDASRTPVDTSSFPASIKGKAYSPRMLLIL